MLSQLDEIRGGVAGSSMAVPGIPASYCATLQMRKARPLGLSDLLTDVEIVEGERLLRSPTVESELGRKESEGFLSLDLQCECSHPQGQLLVGPPPAGSGVMMVWSSEAWMCF